MQKKDSAAVNILQITGEPILRGGQEAFIFNFIDVASDNMHIDVLTPYYCDNDFYRNKLKERGGEIYELNLPFAPGKSRRDIFAPINAFLSKNLYDVIHIHSGSISVLAYISLAARANKVKKIIVHSHSTGLPSLKHKLVKTFFSPIIRICPTHYCACSYDAGVWKFPKNIADKKLVVLKNGIDFSKFSYNPAVRTQLRNQLGISEDCPVVGHVGRFTYEKNHAFLLEVFSKVLKTNPACKLLLIGDGELHSEVENQAARLGICDNIVFIKSVDNIWDYYNVMDVFALPSLYEGFSFVALEAQASGLHVILSDSVPDDVAITDNARYLSLEDANLWANSISQALNIGRSATPLDIDPRGYDIKNTSSQLEDLYTK